MHSDKLRLKSGVPELFIRNLDVPRLRNGTRFQFTHLEPKVLLATDMTGIARGESAKFSSHSDNTEGFTVPVQKVTVPYKISICQAQGQTLKGPGVHLEKSYFSVGNYMWRVHVCPAH
ncbi:hypothetical protein AVEN_190858-1 [Araneus ventricosus]|uniref:DNA helicase Pif1-like 2B domain-containing protein n=1 Tax=Araneus ventricosus TaxID=182803 RepID=A0A4Y2CRY7_ARAVE|nr:hypothetical protein AVEN_190858-1 [Araneus ventricosus]